MEKRQGKTSDGYKPDIANLLRTLKTDINTKNLLQPAKLRLFTSLKSQITSAADAAHFTEDDIRILCYYAFREDPKDKQSTSTIEISHVALKCLANVLLLESKTRQLFVDLGYAHNAANILNNSLEDELLGSRILFLLTYDTKFDFDKLFKDDDLADKINMNISSHAVNYHSQSADKSSASHALPILNCNALNETLKLLFNLNQYYPSHTGVFSDAIKPIFEILTHIELESQPLQPPVTQLINALISLNLPGEPDAEGHTPLFPKDSPNENHLRLISILDSAVRTLKEDQLETAVPLVTLIRRILELAPAPVKSTLQAKLLPSNSERAQPLGKTNSLASHLLRLSTSPIAPNLREGISSLLFELSNKDATTFVRNVGYGFAAGYLMTHSLPAPEGALNSEGGEVEDLGEKMTKVNGQEINPITGQRRDMEPEDALPEMTDEEKEREAEKLFVLFERLKATGVMNVVNPVEQAAREGRLDQDHRVEEVDDDD